MKDYRITVKVRNNRLLRAIEDAGGTPGTIWCSENGLTYTAVNDLINMTISPLLDGGGLSKAASRLCDVLGKIPEDLWSNEQLRPLEKNFSELEMDHQQVVAMLPKEEQSYLPDFSEVYQKQVKELFDVALGKLKPQERDVIRMRFLDDDLTLEECAGRLGVTGERVRQIEAKALRKLREPKVAVLFADAIDNEEKRAYLKREYPNPKLTSEITGQNNPGTLA